MTWNWIQELKSQAKKKVQLIHSNIGEEKYFFRGRCYWNCKQLIKIKKESQTRSIIKSTGTFIGNFYSKKQVWAWKKREERKKEEKINKDYRGIENSTEKWGARSGPFGLVLLTEPSKWWYYLFSLGKLLSSLFVL